MALDFARVIEAAERSSAYAPVSDFDLDEAEVKLGFSLPVLVKRIYFEAGDGGFGPGYGFYGLLEGTDEFPGESVVSLYLSFCRKDPEDPKWNWPARMLPLVDWGCAIRSCVDCSDESLGVVRFDPHQESRRGSMFVPESFSLESWLEAWLRGEDLS